MSALTSKFRRSALRGWSPRRPSATGAWLLAVCLALVAGAARAEIFVSMNDDNVPEYEFGSGQRLVTPLGGIMRVEYRGGDRGAGQQDGFTRLGLFRPDYVGDYFVFVDGALSLTDNGALGGNLGAGVRRMTEAGDAFLGANLWYDNSNSFANTVHQVGLGGEYVRDRFDVRANAYFPLDDRQEAPGAVLLSPPTFTGNRILLDTLVPLEVAMTGYDLEIGMITPPIAGIHHLRVAAGAYHYRESGTQNITGVRGRVEGFLTPSVSAGLTVQNDAVFNTSVMFQVIWRPGVDDPALGAAPLENDVESRIAQLARRQYQPVVAREAVPMLQLARHADGELIYVSHADSAAPPGGDGTFEMPTNDIGLAASTAPERAIVYAHGDSVFDGQSVVLRPGQRLLGEGIEHLVDTRQVGPIVLPEVNGGATPIIRDSNLAAITLADDTEVSNFILEDAGDVGIHALNVAGDVNVNHVAIEGGFGGVLLEESTADFVFTETTITDVLSDSFVVLGGAPDVLYTGDMTNTLGFSGALIRIESTTGGQLEFSGGTLFDSMGDGFVAFDSASDVIVENFTSSRSNFDGISLLFNSGDFTFRNVVIDRPLFSGVDMFLNEESTIRFTNLEIDTNMARGVVASINGMLIIDGDSRITTIGDAALDIFETTVDITLNEVETFSPIINGVSLIDVRGGITINGGVIDRAGLDGIYASNVERLVVRNLEILDSGFSGVSVEVLGDTRSDITLDNLVIDGSFDPSEFRFLGAEGAELYLNLTGTEDSQGFLFERDSDGTIFFAGSLGQGMGFVDTNGNLANNGNTTGGGPPTEIISGMGNLIQIVDPSEVRLPE